VRTWAVWTALGALMAVPVVLAGLSPLLAYRDAPYIAAGLGGALALSMLLVQPLLGLRALPGLAPAQARMAHRAIGLLLSAAVTVHIGGLYLTSPPDTLDALLLVSPTPFSVYGVMATVALLLTATLVLLRRCMPLTAWRGIHAVLGLTVITGSIVHALLIEGTMDTLSKITLCTAIGVVALYAVAYGRLIAPRIRRLRARKARPRP